MKRPRKAYERQKPRVQGKIATTFTSEQRAKLHELLRENFTYEQIQERLKSKYGITVSSSTLSNYYKQHGFEIIEGDAFSGTSGGLGEGPGGLRFAVQEILIPGGKIQIRQEVRWVESPAQEGNHQ
jgi:hypothetical protein